jgi:hypothetical protein
LRLRDGSNLLRAATHGRGLWELRTDLAMQPTVDLFVRDHIMDTGRPPTSTPVPAAWEDPTRYISLNDPCCWWHCADIKTDAPPIWQLQPGEVNYFNFETKLTHQNPEKGNQNRVYVQVHNRGPLPANNVTVKIMVAGASAGLPDLPTDFWTAWPNSAGDVNWASVGLPQTIATLEPLRPTVLQWDWTPPASADAHSCILVVIDSPSDPIPASTKTIFNIGQLVTTEKHAGLKNLHVVNLLPDSLYPFPFYLYGSRALRSSYLLLIPPLPYPEIRMGMLLSKTMSRRMTIIRPKGLKVARLANKDLRQIREHWLRRELRSEASWKAFVKTFDTQRIYSIDPRSKGLELPLSIRANAHENIMLLFRTGKLSNANPDALATLTITQLTAARRSIVGGSTFVFKGAKQG